MSHLIFLNVKHILCFKMVICNMLCFEIVICDILCLKIDICDILCIKTLKVSFCVLNVCNTLLSLLTLNVVSWVLNLYCYSRLDVAAPIHRTDATTRTSLV